jgi:hypothetical protein
MISKLKLSIVLFLFCATYSKAIEGDENLPAIIAKAGFGIGVPYGVFGGGAEIGNQYFAVMGGFGNGVIVPEMTWSLGLKAYFKNSSNKWRPNVAALYGITGMYLITGAVEAQGLLKGMAFYLSTDHDVGNPGSFVFSYGVGFITHDDIPKSVIRDLDAAGAKAPDLGLPIKLTVGLNYRFEG